MGTIVSPVNGSNVYKGAVVPVSYRSDAVDFGCGSLSKICLITYELDGVIVVNLVNISQTGVAPQTQANQPITMPAVGATATIKATGIGVCGQQNDSATATVNLIDPPTVACSPATAITQAAAQVNGTLAGTLIPGGSARFAWGTPAPATNIATTYAAGTVSANLAGLLPGTTYVYRLEVLDQFGNVVTVGPNCNFTTLAATSVAKDAQLVKICSITGATLMKDCDTGADILFIEVTASDGDVIPTTSTEFLAGTGAGVFSTMGFYRSYYADLHGAYLAPQPVNPCASSLSVTRQEVSGAEVLTFNSTTPVTLTVPTGANIAEISIDGGSVRFTTDGIAPSNVAKRGHRVADGGFIELESANELTGFRLLGLAGQTGTIYVEYFALSSLTN